MKDVRAISRDEDFFEQMKQIMGQKTWCFIDEKVLEHIKKQASCYTADSVLKRIMFYFAGKDISVEDSSCEVWHRVLGFKTHDMYVNVCKDPEEVIFITME